MSTVSDIDRHTSAIDAVYRATTSPELWPEALTAIATVFNDVGVILSHQREDGSAGTIVSPSLVSARLAYEQQWCWHDVFHLRSMQPGNLKERVALTDLDLMSEHEFAADPYSTGFLAVHGLRWRAAITLFPAPDIIITMNLLRADTRQFFGATELKTLNHLGQHVENALRFAIERDDDRRLTLTLGDAFSRLGIGVFVLDGKKRILSTNPTAERLLTEDLTAAGGLLSTRSPKQRQALTAVLTQALNEDSDFSSCKPPLVMLRDTDGRKALAVYALPMAMVTAPLDSLFASAKVLVLAIESNGQEPDPAAVGEMLGLTLGEAKVAALVGSGLPPREAAGRLGIAEGTARTVLKRVFEKSGVSRQAELAMLVTRLALA